MSFDDIAVFTKVVQTGSFGKAAAALSLSKSTVSTKVAQLEERLGVTLLQRTTRKLHTTSAGQTYFEHCARALEILVEAQAHLHHEQSRPQGLLKLTVPAGLADSVVPRILYTFEKAHPAVDVEVLVTDRYVDLVGEGFDLAIRGGRLSDSNLIAKKIGSTEFGLFASPAYIRKHGAPRRMQDLHKHDSMVLTFKGTIQLMRGKEVFDLPTKGRIHAENLALSKRLALMGTGIALLDSLNCVEEIKSGRLIRLLPEWKEGSYPVHLVYPAHKFVAPKLRVFMETAAKVMADHFAGG